MLLLIDVLGGRFLIPQETLNYIRYNNFRTRHVYHHHGLIPMRSAQVKWGDRTYPVHTNSLGFMSSASDEVRTSSQIPRWLLMGDSFAEGIGVTYPESFAGRLQGELGDVIDVLNASVASMCPRLHLLKLRYLWEAEGLRFDELLVFLDISDIQDEIIYRHYQPERSLEDAAGAQRFEHLKTRFKNYRRCYSFFNYAFAELGRLPKRSSADQHDGNMPADPEKFVPGGRGNWPHDLTAQEQWANEGLALAAGQMEQLIRYAEERDVKVTLCVYPWPQQLPHLDAPCKQETFWQQFSERHEIGFVNLFDLFRQQDQKVDLAGEYYIAGDIHWNIAGHQLVGDYLVNELVRRDGS